ncbi:MAG: ATP-binding protein [Thermodesulfovibrionia bacterium]
MRGIFKNPERSLGAKLIITIGLSLIIVTSIFWLAILHKQEKDIHSIAVRSGKSFVEFIKRRTRHNMLTFNRAEIQSTIEDISVAEGVERVRIFDHNGKVFYSTFRSDIGEGVNRGSIACSSCHLDLNRPSAISSEPKNWEIYKNQKGVTTLKLIEPINNERVCYTAECHVHKEGQGMLGFIEADISLAILDEAQFRQGLALTGYVVIFFIVISSLLLIILYRLVSSPINELAIGMKRVSEGDLDYRVSIKNKDEIGVLRDAFNSMAEELRSARKRLEEWTHTLEDEVKKKTEEIRKTQEGLLQTEKLASLGRMAAGVAHEINNPLTGIVTFAHLLKRRFPADSPEAEDINIIIEQSERCARIIKNLLTFARATPSEKGLANINDIISRTIYLIKNQEKFLNIKFDISLDESQLVTQGDTSQLQQIFLNMLINAADAMNERGTITIATRKRDIDKRPFIEIEFTDTGCGIKEEDMSKIFEPFFTTKPVGKGTGLGLSVSYGIIKNLGGDIRVKSTVGKGTSFFILLPLAEGLDEKDISNRR